MKPSSTSRPTGRSPGRLLLLSVLLASSPASAGSSEEFKQHFEKARDCYERKEFDCAVEELKAAYQIKQLTALLLNIGHAYLDSGRPVQALEYYDLFLRTEKNLTAQARSDVERYRSDAQQKLAAQQAAQAATPQPEPPKPVPPQVVPETKPEVKSQPPVAPWVLMSSGAALLIVGLGLGGGALSASKQVVQGDGNFDTALDERGRLMNKMGIAFDVVGGLAFAAGAGWGISWLVKRHGEPQKTTPIADLKLRPNGAGLLVQGRF